MALVAIAAGRVIATNAVALVTTVGRSSHSRPHDWRAPRPDNEQCQKGRNEECDSACATIRFDLKFYEGKPAWVCGETVVDYDLSWGYRIRDGR